MGQTLVMLPRPEIVREKGYGAREMGSLPLGHLHSSKGKQTLVNPLLSAKLHVRCFRVLIDT